MKKTDNLLTYLLILFVGIAIGMITPASWYPAPPVLGSHTTAQVTMPRR